MLIGSLVSASCGDDEVSVPDHLRGDPTCMWIVDTWGHFADGGKRLISDEKTRWAGAACVCMTDAEFESKSRADELNDMALEICEELATQHSFEWTECQQDHDDGEWLEFFFPSAGGAEHPSGTALGCVGE